MKLNYKESERKQMVRKPSSELKKRVLYDNNYGLAKVVQAFTEIKVTKAESNIKLIPIEKKFFKLFLKSCTGGRFSYLSIQIVVKLWTLKVNRKLPGIVSA